MDLASAARLGLVGAQELAVEAAAALSSAVYCGRPQKESGSQVSLVSPAFRKNHRLGESPAHLAKSLSPASATMPSLATVLDVGGGLLKAENLLALG